VWKDVRPALGTVPPRTTCDLTNGKNAAAKRMDDGDSPIVLCGAANSKAARSVCSKVGRELTGDDIIISMIIPVCADRLHC